MHALSSKQYDLIIVGAGPVGLALAGLMQQRSTLRTSNIAIIDKSHPEQKQTDPRAIALSYGSQQILQSIGWPTHASPIRHIHISKQNQFGKTLLSADEYQLPALGYVCHYGKIIEALYQPLQHTSIDWYFNSLVQDVQQTQGQVQLALQQQAQTHVLQAKLLIQAEGSVVHSTQPAHHQQRNYQQTALVTTITAPNAPTDYAWERFTAEGPLAALPFNAQEKTFSVVWCSSDEKAKQRQAMSESVLIAELMQALAHPIGQITHCTPCTTFPLGLSVHPQRTATHIIQVGNAAQTLHPVAGQGLNLGLRDAATLVNCLSTYQLTTVAFDHFIRKRHVDRRATIFLTDFLAQAFTFPLGPLSPFRGLALSALHALPPFKRILVNQMLYGQRR